ncbi:MAG TPA: PQQ-binding-like beta-propeller repeat protein [Verrucomicrobiae bacterium]
MRRTIFWLLHISLWHLAVPGFGLLAADQPQWGQAWSRNLVSTERDLPDVFDPENGKNVKWSVELGTETHATPVIAGGRIYIGTNNGHPRDAKHEGDRGVLMCLDEATGRLLWQLVVPKRIEDIFFDWPNAGICSPVTVEGDRVYLVSNRGEVMCLDAPGMANGNDGPYLMEGAHMDPKLVWLASSNAPLPAAEQKLCDAASPPGPLDADILWLFELTSGAGIWSHDSAHSGILVHGDYLYLNTGTGVDNTHRKIRTPDAPGLVVLDKRTGRLIARDNEHTAPNIFHSTWSAPSMAEVNGRSLLFFAGGNGIVYSFEPVENGVIESRSNGEAAKRSPAQASAAPALQDSNAPSLSPALLKKVWQFDFDPAAPKTNVHKYNSNRRESPSNIFGMPVFDAGRLYVAGGGDIWWGKNEAWVKCIDATKTGDITTNGLVWSAQLDKHVMATPAVAHGLVFIVDCPGTLHCLDAVTGQPCWSHQLKGDGWASPFVADGKVYLGTRSGEFYIFAAAREKKLLTSKSLGSPVSATVTAANGVLYVATMNRLFAVRRDGP